MVIVERVSAHRTKCPLAFPKYSILTFLLYRIFLETLLSGQQIRSMKCSENYLTKNKITNQSSVVFFYQIFGFPQFFQRNGIRFIKNIPFDWIEKVASSQIENHSKKTVINVVHACAQLFNNFHSHAWQSCHNEQKHSRKMPTPW